MLQYLWSCYGSVFRDIADEEHGNAKDFRNAIHPKTDYRATDERFRPLPYYQVFRDKYAFVPNLSIVDLLFNMRAKSLLVLRDSLRL